MIRNKTIVDVIKKYEWLKEGEQIKTKGGHFIACQIKNDVFRRYLVIMDTWHAYVVEYFKTTGKHARWGIYPLTYNPTFYYAKTNKGKISVFADDIYKALEKIHAQLDIGNGDYIREIKTAIDKLNEINP